MQEVGRVCLIFSIVALFILLPGCSETEVMPTVVEEVSDETKDQFKSLGFDVSDIALVADDNPLSPHDGNHHYLLEGDITVSQAELESMLASGIFHQGAVGEQYRTTNLVRNNRTIRILGYTGGSNALDSKLRSGLILAVANFNALNTGLNFVLYFGTNSSVYDIVVMKIPGKAGGSSGFPNEGQPYKWVKIYSETSTYSIDVAEHVITHEIGHSIGLRHTDYFDRSLSCGYGNNEGSDGVGAIKVPGTPAAFDPTSIMLSCFKSTSTGEFGNYDRIALEYLY